MSDEVPSIEQLVEKIDELKCEINRLSRENEVIGKQVIKVIVHLCELVNKDVDAPNFKARVRDAKNELERIYGS